MNNPIITVRDMNLWYGQTQALKNINIDIPEKSITALIGPSGCGKSTFLKSLNRMQDLVPGVKIIFFNASLWSSLIRRYSFTESSSSVGMYTAR